MPMSLPLVLPQHWHLASNSVDTSLRAVVDMIVKSESPPANTKSFHLSCLDQNVVRVYTQTLSIFPFPDLGEAESAIHALQHGLRLSLEKFPFLAGTLSLADTAAGTLALRYPVKLSDEEFACIFRTKSIQLHQEHFPYTYEELKRNGMPPSAFKSATFVPDDFVNYPGIPATGEGKVDFTKSDAPAMRIQANFIPGGLVLAMYMHHTVLDFSGVTSFWQTYCANVCKVSGLSKFEVMESSSVADEQSLLRLAVDEQIPAQPVNGPKADAYCDGTYAYKKTLPVGSKCTQRLLVIPAARVREFRERLRPFFHTATPPTLCNVLAALVWTHVTRARAQRLMANGYTETNIGIATDLRRRQEPPVPASYMGNMALFSKGTLNIEDFLAEDSVSQETILVVIRKIKSTILDVNNDWISRHLSFFKSIDKITDTECALALTFGSDIYITSWLNFGADFRWGIPGTDLNETSLAGRPEFIRRSYGPGDGGMIFLPRRRQPVDGKEAPFEILVRLAEDDMQRVLGEQNGLTSWADAVIE